jgi:hypothetical protein
MLSANELDRLHDVIKEFWDVDGPIDFEPIDAVVDAIAEERARPAREVLKKVEWCGYCEDLDCCPCCAALMCDEHEPNCDLAAEIAKLPKVTT